MVRHTKLARRLRATEVPSSRQPDQSDLRQRTRVIASWLTFLSLEQLHKAKLERRLALKTIVGIKVVADPA